ncbi:diguanylate cyclase (GGDEF) domain-containing protein [Candidatus Electrothrix aarhusensis]|uniref:Diguanylate cyclase (GGDEF) domain-containing protein n=1 Tax=Candidatus Electrothrix aarhusensis TaxID=1859131 RepID=A0A3S3RPP4_9BACT|nr:diguanylate cyclase (GGDEF) domain-containing protein [Candidatus Electrothrix aarhusensis]
MILFCEECGQRNSITLTPSLVENNSFTCQFCHFNSPFPFLDQERQSTGSNPGITWEPEMLRLGPEAKKEEQRFQLIFKVTEIQAPELSVEPFQDFAHLITVEKTASDSFTVIVNPIGTDDILPPGSESIGLIYCEEHLMSWGTIKIAYEEQVVASAEEEEEEKEDEIRSFGQKKSRKARDGNYEILHQQLDEYKTQLHQAKTTSFRLQKELSIRRQVMDNQDCGILFINLEQRIVYANPVFLKRTGYSLKAIQSKRIDQVIRLTDCDCTLKEAMKQSVHQDKWEGRAFLKDAIRQGNWQDGEDPEQSEEKPSIISFKFSDGHEEGQEKGFICLLHLEESLTPSSPLKWGAQNNPGNHLSSELTYDALTGLVDRPSFQQYLEDSIQAAQEDQSKIGLLYVDLDHFKRINQIFGPGFGDKILCSVSTILQQCGQEAGADLVARLSGDEFALILPPPSDKKNIEDLAEKIMERFRTPVNNESRAILIRPSIGFSLYPDDGETPLDVLRNADTAMEAAKSEGGNKICSWNTGMKVQAAQSLYLENDLRQAVADDGLINFYQPQINLLDGSICGMEALARWIHPVKGLISPAAFIPIAESTGLIEKLGIDLVRQACLQGKKWRDMGFRKFIMAVNISGRLLRRRDLFYQIMSCIESTGFPPHALEVEFTEGVLIENMDFTVDLINKLRAEGIKLAIDDFGTGYSSLSYLQHLQVDKIKIDRSFITNVTTNNTDAAITLGIIAIAQNLHFRVIAEGIETEEHLFFLQKNQCHEGQGFLFSPPIPEKEMTGLLLRDCSVALNHKRMIDKFYSIKA